MSQSCSINLKPQKNKKFIHPNEITEKIGDSAKPNATIGKNVFKADRPNEKNVYHAMKAPNGLKTYKTNRFIEKNDNLDLMKRKHVNNSQLKRTSASAVASSTSSNLLHLQVTEGNNKIFSSTVNKRVLIQDTTKQLNNNNLTKSTNFINCFSNVQVKKGFEKKKKSSPGDWFLEDDDTALY
jgi:hypothetical protein